MNYYNEFDPKASAWLRELIAMGLIPAGDVDERSITDVKPDDLLGYTQCHFFAGIGGWSHALRLADWPDTLPIWTGSCPCQPFSCAGAGGGQDDPRHLWPVFFKLIKAVRPVIVIGEQVASKAALVWFDGVCADLESEDYAHGAVDLCAAGVNSPNIRQRLYWMSYSRHEQARREARSRETESGRPFGEPSGRSSGMGDTFESGLQGFSGNGNYGSESGWINEEPNRPITSTGGIDFWAQYELIPCRDGKFRRMEPGVPPLIGKFEPSSAAVADGVSGGMVRGSDSGIQEDQSDAKEIVGWRTPTSGDARRGFENDPKSRNSKAGTGSLNNEAALAGWGTPRVTNNGGVPCPEHTGKGSRIEDQTAIAGWPTPMAGTEGAGNNDGSRKMVEISGWPTPSSEGSAGEVSDDLERRGGKFVNTKTGRVLQTNLATDVKMLTGLRLALRIQSAEDSESTGAHRGTPDTMTSAARLAPSEIQPIHWVNATGEGLVMRLKGYGNAINPVLASEFVVTVAQIIDSRIPTEAEFKRSVTRTAHSEGIHPKSRLEEFKPMKGEK